MIVGVWEELVRLAGIGRGNQRLPHGSLADALADPRRYQAQIDRLQRRHQFDGGLNRLTQDGVSLASLVMHRNSASRKLARAVASGAYHLQPATTHVLRVEGKKRTVFAYPLLDLVVHGVVADLLTETMAPTLSEHLYSYRSGVSWARGVSALARYVREHRRAHPDPRTRGLYVLRRDIASYTDTIPVDEASQLWSQIAELVGKPRTVDPLDQGAHDDSSWRLVREIVRPHVRERGGRVKTRNRGVPTGQPISCVAFNLYLRDLDHELARVPGAFVARYSDDLIVAHPDPEVARRLSRLLDERLAELGLMFNAEKSRDLYLTGAGRQSLAWPEANGTTSVEFLGMRIGMDGAVALGGNKVRELLRDARRRAQNTARTLCGQGEAERGRATVAVVNALLDADSPHLRGSVALLLAGMVTDRQQLDWLDHQLARIVAGAVSGDHRAAAFRRIPYRRIRDDWGLVSLRFRRDQRK